ncbi:MAG: peptidyl-dipeptidase [Bacteroidota bacterium]|nr:peptidyl-dipeptidase [Bacteroidota bacterium]
MKIYSFRFILFMTAAIFTISLIGGCGKQNAEDQAKQEEIKKMEQDFDTFVQSYVDKMKPLTIQWWTSYFDASISGKKEDFAKSDSLEMLYNQLASNKDDFAKLKKFKESGLIRDSIKQRTLTVIYNEFLSKQIDTAKLNAMTKLQTQIVQQYNSFRADVDGKKLSDNEIEQTLKESTDTKQLEKVWLAHKKIGPVVADDLKKLVKMRNEAAKELGFNNYHEMSLKLSEQDPAEISKLFDELDNLTRDSFKKVKDEMDKFLADRLKIKPEELQPWHYQNRYFQEAPQIYEVDVDTYYKDKDIVKTTVDYYKSLNMPIEDMVAKSDLFEKEGKNQHAYCIDIDRDAHDIRVLCNVKQNSKWMETMLHEYGHALFEKYLGADLPWSLKQPAHIFTTEAIAMMFGRFATNPQWMQDVIKISPEEKAKITPVCKKILILQELVFSRWAQVMYRFEKSMYENPDQDLNKLWWDIVEKYQMVKKPSGRNMPDWATKTHIASSPCYYHNYLLGDLLASQLYYTIAEKVLKVKAEDNHSFFGKPEAGKFLIEKVFAPGMKYYWNDMIERATGEKLTPKYYAKQFVQ